MRREYFLLFFILFSISVVSSYTPPQSNNVTIILGGGYSSPDSDAVVLVLGGVDPCAYSGSGTWDLPCGCNITSNIDLGGNPIVISGSGVIRVEAAVTGVSYVQSPNSCGVSGDSIGYIEGTT